MRTYVRLNALHLELLWVAPGGPIRPLDEREEAACRELTESEYLARCGGEPGLREVTSVGR